MAVAKQEIDNSLLKRFSPLDELDHDKLGELASKSTLIEFGRGEAVGARLVKNGTVFLVFGAVDRAPGTADAETIRSSTDRARRAILSPQDRTRVVAKTDVSVLCVDTDLLDFLSSVGGSASCRNTGIIVDEFEANPGDWIDGLMRSDVIANLSPASIQALMAAIEPVQIEADEVIFDQGDAADFYYIVSSGSCLVTRRDPGVDAFVDLAALGPGGAFGEEALITGAPRNATVRMVEKGTVLRLRQSDFKRMLEQPSVRTVSQDQLPSLESKGATMLYIHSGNDAGGGDKSNSIAIAELRERMAHLNKALTYIVTSDDQKISAAAAFILAQKRFDVCIIAAAAHTQSSSAAAAASSPPICALETTAARLEDELAQMKVKLDAEQKNHAEAKDRVRVLETDLQATRAGAKAAMSAASDLKVQSESLLRQQIKELSKALQEEKERSQSLAKQAADLYQQLSALQNELNLSREQSHQLREESQARETMLTDTVREFEQAAAQQDERLQQIQNERESLQEEYDELENRHDVLLGEKRSIEEQFAQLSKQKQGLQDQYSELESVLQQRGEEFAALQLQYADLEGQHASLNGEKQALASELMAIGQDLEGRGQRIEALQTELGEATSRGEGLEGELQSLQAGQEQLQESLDRAEQQNIELEKARNELYMQVMSVTSEAKDQESAARTQRNALEKKIEDLSAALEGAKETLRGTEVDAKQQIDTLRNELAEANQKLVKLNARAARHESDNRLLTEEADALRSASKRRGAVITALSVLLLIAGGVAFASFIGVDIKGSVDAAIALVKPLLDNIVNFASSLK